MLLARGEANIQQRYMSHPDIFEVNSVAGSKHVGKHFQGSVYEYFDFGEKRLDVKNLFFVNTLHALCWFKTLSCSPFLHTGEGCECTYACTLLTTDCDCLVVKQLCVLSDAHTRHIPLLKRRLV